MPSYSLILGILKFELAWSSLPQGRSQVRCEISERCNVLLILDVKFLQFQVVIIYAKEIDVYGFCCCYCCYSVVCW